jgi:hypothetical protein
MWPDSGPNAAAATTTTAIGADSAVGVRVLCHVISASSESYRRAMSLMPPSHVCVCVCVCVCVRSFLTGHFCVLVPPSPASKTLSLSVSRAPGPSPGPGPRARTALRAAESCERNWPGALGPGRSQTHPDEDQQQAKPEKIDYVYSIYIHI